MFKELLLKEQDAAGWGYVILTCWVAFSPYPWGGVWDVACPALVLLLWIGHHRSAYYWPHLCRQGLLIAFMTGLKLAYLGFAPTPDSGTSGVPVTPLDAVYFCGQLGILMLCGWHIVRSQLRAAD